MSFNDLARKRYSCRKLAAKPVEQEKLDAIIGKKGLTLLYKLYCICLTVGCGMW